MSEAVKKERRVRDRPFLRAITYSYLLATFLLAVFAVSSHIVLQDYTESEATSAAQINISGRQRMLSQKIAMLGNRLVQQSVAPDTSTAAEPLRRELLATIEEFEQSHKELIQGNPARHLPSQHSEAIQAIYLVGPEALDAQMERFVAEAKALSATEASALSFDNAHLQFLNEAAGGGLLATLNAVVKQHQKESERNIYRLQWLQEASIWLTLAILLLLILFVFRPMTQRIRSRIRDLRDAETMLRREKAKHQKAEERFHSVVEASPVAMLGADSDGTIVLCNQQSTQTFGYERQELVGMQIEALLPKRFRDRHKQYRDNYASERSTRSMGAGRELFGLRKDGHEFPAEIGISTAETSEGTIFMTTIIDISARREAEKALQLERAYSDSLVETTQAIVLVLELDGTIRYFNPYMEQLSGYRLEEVKGKEWFGTFIPEHDRPEIRQLAKQAISGQLKGANVNPIVTKDGRHRVIEWHNKTLMDLNGQVTSLLATGMDITDRVRDEETLRQSEEKFRLLFELSSDGICVLDMDGNFIDINRIFHEQLGYTKQEMMSFGNIAAVNTPQAAEVFIRRISEIDRLGHARFESFYKKKFGMVIPVEVNARLINFKGDQVILASIRDITARRHLEMELAKHRHSLEKLVEARTAELTKANKKLELEIIERLQAEKNTREMAMFPEMNPAPVLKMDRDGIVEMANDAAKEGCQGKEVAGESIFSLCPELTRQDFNNLFQGEQEIIQFETIQHDRNFVFTLLADKEKQHAYAYGADITQIKRLEGQVRQSQKMEAVGQLAGGIAHDFNSLLGVILGFGDMMREDLPADDPLRESLDEIMMAGNRAKELVKELMDFSRPKSNDLIPLQLDKPIEESVRILRASLPTSIQIQTEIREKDALTLANASQIEQVLVNLGINAGDAIGNQAGLLDIALDRLRVDEELAATHEVMKGDYLRLTVRDSGSGISEETMARIFEPFFTTKAVGKGTGLGLAVVHGIVKAHRGFITVESTPGDGSSFHIHLPVFEQEQT